MAIAVARTPEGEVGTGKRDFIEALLSVLAIKTGKWTRSFQLYSFHAKEDMDMRFVLLLS